VRQIEGKGFSLLSAGGWGRRQGERRLQGADWAGDLRDMVMRAVIPFLLSLPREEDRDGETRP